MSLVWPAKDPDNVAEYYVDWADRFEIGETIASSVFTLEDDAGLTIDSQTTADKRSVVWLSGGTEGEVGRIRCRITTSQNRQYDEVVVVAILGLIVEDGSGIQTADTWASLETADAYCAKNVLAWSAIDELKEGALRRAATALSNNWKFKGTRTNGRDQALAFPRTGCTDGEDNDVGVNEIPSEIVHAQIELAVYELANPNGLQPMFTMAERVRSEQVATIRVEYAAAPYTPEAARPTLLKVEDYLSGYLSGGSGLSGSTAR